MHFGWYLSSIAQHYIQTWHDVVLSDVEGKALYVKVAFSWHFKSEILHADISTNFLLYSKSIRSNFYAREFSTFSLSLKLELWGYIRRHFQLCWKIWRGKIIGFFRGDSKKITIKCCETKMKLFNINFMLS